MRPLLIRIEVGGLERLKEAVPIRRAMQQELEIALVRSMVKLEQTGAKLAPRRKGDLARSILAQKKGPYKAVVGSNLIYAGVQEEGATITPKRRQWLAWSVTGERPTSLREWKALKRQGKVRFAKMVRIPGQHYMDRTVDETLLGIAVEYGEAIMRGLRKAGIING